MDHKPRRKSYTAGHTVWSVHDSTTAHSNQFGQSDSKDEFTECGSSEN